MPRENVMLKGYTAWKPSSPRVRKLIRDTRDVLAEFQADLPLTMRQIYYRLVATNKIGKTFNDYQYMDHNLTRARRAGYISWRDIRDDTIATVEPGYGWYAAEQFIHAHRPNADAYYERLLNDQEHYIEVFCESAGMVHQLAQVARPKGILVTGSGGFDSVTNKWEFVERIRKESAERPVVILHLGDADLDGETIFDALKLEVYVIRAQEADLQEHWDALEDAGYPPDQLKRARKDALDPRCSEWMSLFEEVDDAWLYDVHFVRVAVTEEQIAQYGLPWAVRKPGKGGRTGRKPKKEAHRREVQLEAMTPGQIREALETAIDEWWRFTVEEETEQRVEREREKIRRWLRKFWLSENDG